jgi:leader peptidase (prepilin peptidase)/N-methyltransferase
VVRPRSRCTTCGYRLRWFDNVPVVSWLVLKGRCRCCEETISGLYPTIELITAVGWAASVLAFGVSFTALRVAIFGTILLGIAVTDLREYLIPDGFTLTGLVWAFTSMAIAVFLGEQGPFAGPYDTLIGACAGAGLIAIVGWLGEMATGREAMGFGDITLMAFAGAALGPTRAIVTIFAAATIGTVVMLGFVAPVAWMRRMEPAEQTELPFGGVSTLRGFQLPLVPFGVFLAPASMATLFWGDAFIRWLLPS